MSVRVAADNVAENEYVVAGSGSFDTDTAFRQNSICDSGLTGFPPEQLKLGLLPQLAGGTASLDPVSKSAAA